MRPLDCDHVFDVLTRGPFPTGEAIDAPVERHLGCCHECRALAEALRPAVTLFHEAIDAEECRELPGYHGRLSALAGDGETTVAQAVATSPVVRAVCQRPQRWWDNLVQNPAPLIASIAIGAVFALMLWGGGERRENSESIASLPAFTAQNARFAPTAEGQLHLASLELPAACVTPARPAAATIGELASTAFQCCTQCHGAGERTKSASSSLVLAVVNSCQACHP